MNEISIDQGIGFITGNWFWMLPAFLSGAFVVCGLIHWLFGICWSYVFQEKMKREYFKTVHKLLVGDAFRSWDSDGDCRYNHDKVWWIMGDSSCLDFCISSFHCMLIYPLCLLLAGFLIHLAPMWAIYSIISTWGILFAMRSGVSGMKKAKEVLAELNIHKEEKDAHK